MKRSESNRYLFIIGIALFVIGMALVAAAVLVVLFTDYPAAGAAAIGVPGLVLISGTLGLVLSATLGLVLGPTSRR